MKPSLIRGEKMINIHSIVADSNLIVDSMKLSENPQTAPHTQGKDSKEKSPDSSSSEVVLFHGGCVV